MTKPSRKHMTIDAGLHARARLLAAQNFHDGREPSTLGRVIDAALIVYLEANQRRH